MVEQLEALASWKPLLLAVFAFGFAPGCCLRIIVLAYPRDDPRRAELIAELYTVPRIQRPLWVAEQLEVALFEGLAHRATSMTSIKRIRLRDYAGLIIVTAIGFFMPLVILGGIRWISSGGDRGKVTDAKKMVIIGVSMQFVAAVLVGCVLVVALTLNVSYLPDPGFIAVALAWICLGPAIVLVSSAGISFSYWTRQRVLKYQKRGPDRQ